jgi:YHS domain-containing protein
VLLVRFFRTSGLALLQMMNESPAGTTHAMGHETRSDAHDPVTDPVCGMQLSRHREHQTADHRGQRFYFCSEQCRRKFEANPERYARHTA